MLKTRLTQEERRFAAEHHRLIHAYLSRRRLPAEEYYAAAALGYLDAVHRYCAQPALKRHAFSTVASRAMRQSISHAQRSRYGRRHQMGTVSLETGGISGGPLTGVPDRRSEQELEATMLLYAASGNLTAQQRELAWLRVAGYSMREIAKLQNTSEKSVRLQLRKVRRALAWLREAPSMS